MPMRELLKSYAQVPEKQDGRMIEAWGLTQAALHIKAAIEGGDIEELRTAVRLNWRLWTIFQAELLAPDCPLPAEIRNNVLSLAAFVDKRTMDIISVPTPAAAQVLINVNRELAMGLYESLDAHAPAVEAPKPAEVDVSNLKLSV